MAFPLLPFSVYPDRLSKLAEINAMMGWADPVGAFEGDPLKNDILNRIIGFSANGHQGFNLG